MVFALKLVLVPALVAAMSLAARRWGPRRAGLLTALPIVTGPALLFYAIEQGAVFAAEAARGALAALVAVAAAGLAYAWAATRAPWWLCLVASSATFTALTLLVLRAHLGPWPALLAACASFAVMPYLLPVVTGKRTTPRPWALDLPLRMLSAMTLVVTVTGLADRLGPDLSGAFTPFPVALTVLLAFTHAREGAPDCHSLHARVRHRHVELRHVLLRGRRRHGAAGPGGGPAARVRGGPAGPGCRPLVDGALRHAGAMTAPSRHGTGSRLLVRSCRQLQSVWHLRGTTVDLEELLGERRKAILRIAARHGARNVRVFGSVARGDAGPDSDIDLLVDAGPDASAFFPAGLIADLEECLGRRVDVLTECALHWYIRARVVHEAIAL